MNYMMGYNLLLDEDSYKGSQWIQYPDDVRGMISYLESRGGEYSDVMMFGLRYIIQQYLSQRMTEENVQEAEYEYRSQGMPFNADGVRDIIRRHDGFAPVRIRALKEGMVVPAHTAMMTVECNDRQFWFGQWLETMLLRSWYPITVATRSLMMKKAMKPFVDRTSDNPGCLDFMLHDMGARGVSSLESAMIGASAHLMSFMGSDTIAANRLLRHHYNARGTISTNIPAAEHSTITSWGRLMETDAYRNMLKVFADNKSPYKAPMFSCVSDSYDIFNAVSNIWGGTLRETLMASDSLLVVRPDSGNPKDIVMDLLARLDAKFGHVINSKGFKLLKHVRIIQADGVDEKVIISILSAMEKQGWSAENLAFGMGGALLQKLNRDTNKFAIKCCSVLRTNGWMEVYKDPITDKVKTSKKGRQDTILDENGLIKTIEIGQMDRHPDSILEDVFDCGKIMYDATDDYSAIKERVNTWLLTA